MVNEYIKNAIKKIKYLIVKEKDFQAIYGRKSDKRIAIELVACVILNVTIILCGAVLLRNVNLIEEEQSKIYDVIAINSDKITFLDDKEIRKIDTNEVKILIDSKQNTYLKKVTTEGFILLRDPFDEVETELFRVKVTFEESWEFYTTKN